MLLSLSVAWIAKACTVAQQQPHSYMSQVHAAPAACLSRSAVRANKQVLAADVCTLANGDVQRSKTGVRSQRLWHQAARAALSLSTQAVARTMSVLRKHARRADMHVRLCQGVWEPAVFKGTIPSALCILPFDLVEVCSGS